MANEGMNTTDLLTKATQLTRVIKANVHDLIEEWDACFTKGPALLTGFDSHKYVIVERSVLEHFTTEVMLMKEFLPTIINKEYINELSQLTNIEQALFDVQKEKQLIVNERDRTIDRLHSVITEFEKEKKEHSELKFELSEAKQQLEYQSDYCTSLGLVCGTLLWRASQNEQVIQDLISGNKTDEFLCLVSTTLTSFIDCYGTHPPEELSKEMQFIISLCGTVTNIAASGYGRNYISNCSEGQKLIQVSFNVLSLAPLSPNGGKLRSINQNGLVFLRELPNIFQTFIQLVQDETSTTNRQYSLQLIQSLLLEPHSPSLIQHVNDCIQLQSLYQLAVSDQPQLSQLAREIITDIKALIKS